MWKILRFQTSDGAIHETEKAARRYCEDKAGAIITNHTHQICRMLEHKYENVLKYVEGMLPSMLVASMWRQEANQCLVDDED